MSDLKTEAVASAEPPPFVRVLLRRRDGEVLYATVDRADAELVQPFRWHLSNDGYAVRTVDTKKGVKEKMARRIMGLVPGDGLETDHISRDKLDNRRCNLRVVTHAQNMQNRRRTDGKSQHRGVSFRKGRKSRPWHAYGCVGGKQTHLGFHDTEQQAANAARAWRIEHLPYATD